MSYRFLEVGQEDVIWGNLRIKPYEQRARYAASWAATLGLIILWSFPGTSPSSGLQESRLTLALAQSPSSA